MSQPWTQDASHVATDAVIESSKRALGRLLLPGQKFIFNTDLDGVLSAGLLSRYLGWTAEGVGACNGQPNDAFWTTNQVWQPSESVFVDMWVHGPGVRVIDQHITALDSAHHATMASLDTKANPNLLWPRTVVGGSDPGYKFKYPFGVVHFIIAGLEHAGKSVALTNADVTTDFTRFDLLLRADDAGWSTAKEYRPNALSWWDYLVRIGGPATLSLAQYAVSMTPQESERRNIAVQNWLRTFQKPTGSKSSDGGFASAMRRRNNWTGDMEMLASRMLDAIPGTKLSVPPILCRHSLTGHRVYPDHPYVRQHIFRDPKLFAYAFTSGMNRVGNAPGFSHAFWP